jgi:hypothetical protein
MKIWSAEYTEGMHNMHDELDLEEIIRELEGDLIEDDEEEMPEEDPYAVVPEGHEYGHDDDENIDEIIEAILRENEEEACHGYRTSRTRSCRSA